jgi:calnexin
VLTAGPWKAAQIRNPGFYFDPHPVRSLAPVQAIAIEVWTITAGIIFDNFVIATSITDALKYAHETTALKVDVEKKVQKQQETAEKQRSWKQLLESGSYRDLVVYQVQQLSQLVADNPLATAASVALIVLTFLYLVLFGGSKQLTTSTNSAVEGSKEQAESASGADVTSDGGVVQVDDTTMTGDDDSKTD